MIWLFAGIRSKNRLTSMVILYCGQYVPWMIAIPDMPALYCRQVVPPKKFIDQEVIVWSSK